MGEDHLPPKKAFCWRLTEAYISDEDFQHEQQDAETFNLRTMRAYEKLYMVSMEQRFPVPQISDLNSIFQYVSNDLPCI